MKVNTFAERMTEAMRKNNIKQIDLVNKTGLDKSLISCYIKGKYEAKQDNLTLIANALDVNEAWLMGYEVPPDSDFAEQLKDGSFDDDRVANEKDELDKLFDRYRSVLTEEEIEKVKQSMIKRIKEIDKELDESDKKGD